MLDTKTGNVKVAQNPQLREIKYQTKYINISQAAAGANQPSIFSIDFETDKLYKRVIGVAYEIIPSAAGVNSDFLRVERFEIQNREVYSKDYPVKLNLNSSDINPNEKFDRFMNEEAEGSKVNISLAEYNTGAFVAYTVAVILILSNREEDIAKPESTK